MAHKQHNPADDFDLMLRRHLKQGGAPVAPCLGFDADTASAYVERALSAPALLQFETHLAGCAACRRHVVALARLSDQLSPLPAASTAAPVQIGEPRWRRWQNVVAQWFDFSDWNPGWTAATGVACAVLFAALGGGIWWRTQAPGTERLAQVGESFNQATATQAPEFAAGLAGEPAGALADTASANVSPSQTDTDIMVGTATPRAITPIPGSASSARVILPQPTITPLYPPVTNSLVALASAPELRTLAVEPSAPTITAPSAPPPAFNLPATGISFNHLNTNQPAGGMMPVRLVGDTPARSSSQLVLMPGEPEKKELMNELLLPGPRRNRSTEEAPAKSANSANTDAGKATSNRELLKALKGRTFGFMPLKDSEKDDKGIDARTKEADLKSAQEQVKPLMKRLNGHVFFFDHGFWIDEEYNSETKLPIRRLTRGSQEYQQIQIQNPSLEQFFQLGQVIVVWKGVVYEVHK